MKTLLLVFALLSVEFCFGRFPYRVFDNDTVISLKLMGSYQSLITDAGDAPSYHEFTMVVEHGGKPEKEDSVNIRMKTRGNFRRTSGECRLPPLMIDLPGKKIGESNPFYKQRKLKLVVPCATEQHLLSEYLVYRLYNHITTQSFQVQLVRVQFANNKGNEYGKPFFGFLIENEEDLAARLEAELMKEDVPNVLYLNRSCMLRLFLFEFMIGNTDWSIPKQHNIRVMQPKEKGEPIAVPYDFDFCGMVNSPYAVPPEELKMNSVLERRYRGFCLQETANYNEHLEYFKKQKEALTTIITKTVWLNKTKQKEMLGYLSSFYKVIDSDKLWQSYVTYPCDPRNTGNVTIKGYGKEKPARKSE